MSVGPYFDQSRWYEIQNSLSPGTKTLSICLRYKAIHDIWVLLEPYNYETINEGKDIIYHNAGTYEKLLIIFQGENNTRCHNYYQCYLEFRSSSKKTGPYLSQDCFSQQSAKHIKIYLKYKSL